MTTKLTPERLAALDEWARPSDKSLLPKTPQQKQIFDEVMKEAADDALRLWRKARRAAPSPELVSIDHKLELLGLLSQVLRLHRAEVERKLAWRERRALEEGGRQCPVGQA